MGEDLQGCTLARAGVHIQDMVWDFETVSCICSLKMLLTVGDGNNIAAITLKLLLC